MSAGPPPTTLPFLSLPSGAWPHLTSARFKEHSVRAIHRLSTNSENLMVIGIFLPFYLPKGDASEKIAYLFGFALVSIFATYHLTCENKVWVIHKSARVKWQMTIAPEISRPFIAP